MESGSSQVVFTSNETDSEAFQVKPLRASGIVSTLLGLLSAVALAGPYMWVVPVLAIAVGLFALRPSQIPVAGKSMALLGLSLGLFFGGWAVSAHKTFQNQLAEMAKDFALQWLDSFKTGEYEFCFEMTLPERDRHYESVDLARFHAREEIPTEDPGMLPDKPKFKNFMEIPTVKAIVQAKDKPTWQFKEYVFSRSEFGGHQFKMLFKDTSGTIDQDVGVTMQSNLDAKGVHHWLVENIDFAE